MCTTVQSEITECALLTMEQAEQEGCLLEWDSGPSVTVQSVQVVTGRQALVSETSRGLVEVQTSILGQTLVMEACDTHTQSNITSDIPSQQKKRAQTRCTGTVQFINRSSLLLPHTTPQPLYGPFSETTRVSRCQKRNFWTLWCKGRLTEADTPTIRLGATPSRLTSAHLHHPPHFFTGRMPFLLPNQQCQSTAK